MLHLNDHQVENLLEGSEVQIVQYMEDVFKDFVTGRAKMIPKTYLTTRWKGDFRAMPASWQDISGIKWISVFPNNHKSNLPTIHGTLLLNDTLTGEPIISMDCAKLTGYRTAAVSALAAKHLTVSNIVHTLTFIGCGYQSKLHMMMYAAVFPNIKRVKLYDINTESVDKLMHWMDKKYKLESVSTYDNIPHACSNADVITTLTPSTEAYLGLDDIDDTVMHINAIGADAPGKRELKDDIWQKFDLVVDDEEQATHSGETQYVDGVPHYTLKELIQGGDVKDKPTVFDSTGLAIEDIAIGKLIYEKYNQGN